MELGPYRRSQRKTLEQAAADIGLRSKGYLSRIERGLEKPSVLTAMRIEAWSGGVVPARTLRPDIPANTGFSEGP